ncbi:hypothetical protein NQ314_005808 [Rhamnusium bicolor]|uniref:Exportin-4 n=1 Tax=Rhamnusium bicolor TaxID=1586634 RepID=A0AAV8ZCU2_9CUCU|nr:hypothetical protein NQ314_005808 [Rhamnusium bicolor]
MTDQIISELENAAGIIMAPPNVVTNEQRHAAESIFLDFRKNSDRVSLRQYLLQYVTMREVPPFVRDRILQVIAIMVKRASIDDSGRERANLLQEVENLIVNAEPHKKILGCNIISNLMQEYATTVKSTDVGLPWGSIYESVYESDSAPALKLTASWSEIILTPDLLPLMFQIYWKVRESEQLAHHSLTCLVQLGSLSGGIVSSDEVRLKYLHSYLMTFFNLISNVTIKNKESLGISNIVKKLIIFYIHDVSKLPETIQDTLLDEFTRLTCNFCDGAAIEETQSDEDAYFCDAFDNMLEAWTTILQEFGSSLDNNLLECSKQIFNKYLQCHLAPLDGCRQSNNGEVEDIEDNEDNDRIRFKDQLQTIGMFGRIVPGHALPVLFKLLEVRIEKLVNHIQTMQSRAMNISEAVALDNLFEDIHWIILISGHVLCMDSDGETPMIPSEIMQYSIEQHNRHETTLDATVKALVAVESKVAIPENFNHCDHVIRIVFNVMKLCAVEDYAVSIKLAHFMSPEVGSTLMWFLKRWCLSYLLPVENYYQELSPTLIGCLGKDTDCAKLVSEPVLLRDTVDLFCDIVCVKQKSTHIVKTESMRNLIQLHEQMIPGTLPPNILRGLCKGFVLAGVALQNPQDMNSYYEMILTPVQQRFKNLLGQEDFTRICHQEKVQKIVIDILECFIGIAKGSQMASVEILFHFLAPMLSELPVFLTVYSNYQVIVQLILELFGQCAKYMLCYLSPIDSKRLYESSLATVQAYAKCNAGRLSTESIAEENSFQDLALVLDLLTFILSKDCIDLCTNTNNEEINVTASDVSLFGLNFIMPLMTMDLLKYPSLCAQYYRLLVLINDIYPEKICNLPSDLLHTLLRSVEIGLTNFGSDIVQACLDFVQGMATYTFRHNLLNTPFSQGLKPFLKLLMDLTLSHQINSDLMSSASTCIYALVCCYQDEYQMLVQSLIQVQSDPMTAERLAAAFNNLMLNVATTCERQPKLRFRDNFDKFIANVHGFLLVK